MPIETVNKPGGWLADLVGIVEGGEPDDSEWVEEILMTEFDSRNGWTLRPYQDEIL